ncbi:hypothetical protein PIB30_052186 [Stylosanthes scabra]|uniref:Uncharacterized protein n=1 Tax=Stylosanthes scabra TaxID=79078 RepID=A0ABU6UIY7_9FABA|nr:hypothetical protein [Stylosanthes scabra]
MRISYPIRFGEDCADRIEKLAISDPIRSVCSDEERKSPREAKKNKEARRMDKKPKKSPTQRQPRARALKMARPRPPFLNMEVSVGGAPARPRWCACAAPFRNAQDKDLASPRGDGRTHLNEG